MKYTSFILLLLFYMFQVKAQTNFRPHGSKNTDHSYFKNGTVRFISSSHQDIAWMDSIAACEKFRDEKMISPALANMKKDPAYCFRVEDALSLREYLQRHPERYNEILTYTRQGRLEWGGTYNMPYESMYDGEALIRQTYLGRKWLQKTLPGCDFTIACNEDVPGRAMQMPQILAKSGIRYLEISRHEAGIYRWYSPDGSNVLMYTPGHYDGSGRDIWGVKTDKETRAGLINHLNAWDIYYKTNRFKPVLPILISTDWAEPRDFSSFFSAWNSSAKAEGLPLITYSSSLAAFKALDAPGARYERLTGERPNVWLYIHGPTHEHALTASRMAGRALTAAEKFASIDATLHHDLAGYPEKQFTTAWENAIYPDHGWGGKHGDMTDLAFRNKFETAGSIARSILQKSLSSIAGSVGFTKKGPAIVIFNPLSWERSDQVELSLNVYGRDTVSYKLIDAGSGIEVPSQRIISRPAGGSDEVVTIVFVAEKVPSLGYKTYYLQPFSAGLDKRGVPISPTQATSVRATAKNHSFENRFYKVEFGSGGLKSIVDKELNKELLKTDKLLCGEVFQLESIGNGAGEFSDVQPVTMNGFEKVSQYAPEWTCTESGPVRSSWEFTQQTKFATIRQTVSLFETLKKIDFKTEILGFSGERYREYRMAFPLAQSQSKVAYEVPMGVVEVGKSEIKGAAGFSYGTQDYSTECAKVHPREVQDWFNASKANSSVTISSSVAVFDWKDATDSTNSFTVLQPILLSSRKSCHGEGNYYLQTGNHEFQFSLSSGPGDWQQSIHSGKQQNQPLQAIQLQVNQLKPGLPLRFSFAGVNADNLIISTIKKGDDSNSIIMRLVDMQGRAVDARIDWFGGHVGGVNHTNMIEEEDKPLKKFSGAIPLPVSPYSIETIRIN